MTDIDRVFMSSPRRGSDAAWFDAVKRGDTAGVQRMLAAGQNQSLTWV